MTTVLARELMEEFADATGVSGKTRPRRYLWTDAFAVCNFLGLFRQSGDDRFLALARELIEQVHHILGRHRDDDTRHGWISGLSETEGEQHPTCGGLRIGKRLNERGPHQRADERLEWDQDGQYFHYLTKWMHALYRMGRETGEDRYLRWAAELAMGAHRAFTREIYPGGPKRILWKMSIDLSRPLVASTGQHDPLDGLITCLELQTAEGFDVGGRVELASAIAETTEMCQQANWATDDPLGIGGLLDDASRLAQLVFERKIERHELLHQMLVDAGRSLVEFGQSSLLRRSAEHRLAFRELGLSIGLHAVPRIRELVASDRQLTAISSDLLPYLPLAEQIERFWCDPEHRRSSSWLDHRDINEVMLATSLLPASYLQF